MVSRRGHCWLWHARLVEVVRLQWAEGRGADEVIASTPPLRAEVATCSDCGMLIAERPIDEGDGTFRYLRGYGFDLDSLTLRGAAPPCEPFALSRPPHALAEVAA